MISEQRTLASLFEWNQETHRLALKEWLRVFHAVARELNKFHTTGHLHNNINGSNILIKQEEENCYLVSIIDFRFASPIGTQITCTVGDHNTPASTSTSTSNFIPCLGLLSEDNFNDRYDVYCLGLLMDTIMVRDTSECPLPIKKLIQDSTHFSRHQRPTMASLTSSLQRCVEQFEHLSLQSTSTSNSNESSFSYTEDEYSDSEDDVYEYDSDTQEVGFGSETEDEDEENIRPDVFWEE